MSEKIKRIWCVKCDKNMTYTGIALDCPKDGFFYECTSCNNRIVVFEKNKISLNYIIRHKYFHDTKITGKDGEKESFIVRECPICKINLSEFDFALSNENDLKTAEIIWQDKRIMIPCCICYNLLDYINRIKENLFIFMNHYISYPILSDVCQIKRQIISSLFKLGFISSDIKDDLLKRYE